MRPARLLLVRGHEDNKLRLSLKSFAAARMGFKNSELSFTDNFGYIKYPPACPCAIRSDGVSDLKRAIGEQVPIVPILKFV